MIDKLGEVAVALVVSAVISTGVSVSKQQTYERLLEDNLKVTSELASAVNKLETGLAVFGERYITRKELESTLDKREGDYSGPRIR